MKRKGFVVFGVLFLTIFCLVSICLASFLLGTSTGIDKNTSEKITDAVVVYDGSSTTTSEGNFCSVTLSYINHKEVIVAETFLVIGSVYYNDIDVLGTCSKLKAGTHINAIATGYNVKQWGKYRNLAKVEVLP